MAYTEATVLGIVKARLNRLASDTSLDSYLKQRIAAADKALRRTGIYLVEDDIDDAVFLADFVAWQHNNRDKDTGMPEWLRLARRERFISGKGRRTEPVTADPSFGTIAAGGTITLACETVGATIYYTMDGTEPDDSSTPYTEAISPTTSFELRAAAYAEGLTPSIEFRKIYIVSEEA